MNADPSPAQAAPTPINSVAPDVAVAPPPPAPPAPAAAPRLNPALGAKEAAMKMYPALAVKDSTFNKTFRDLYVEKTQLEPEFLARADWPLLLARRTAELLTIQPMTPAAPAASPTPTTPRPVAVASSSTASGHTFNPTAGPNPLNRGAYNRGSSYWWPYNGSYVQSSVPAPAVAASTAGQTGQPTPSANPLDRGAYNQVRSPYWWYWHYYYP
ncbi:MAG: hypothetical protein WDN28_31965 [Chthoniobacter sp.]